jgi:hypothetical protein
VNVEQLLADLRRELRPLGRRRRRRGVLAEARDHLLSGIEEEMASGATAEEAERRVVERYGDAAAVARSLLLAHPPKPAKALQVALVAAGALAGVAGTALVSAARDPRPPAKHRVAFRLQTPDSMDEARNSTSPTAAFRRLGLLWEPSTHTPTTPDTGLPLTRRNRARKLFEIRPGSVFSGHAAWVVGRPGHQQCWMVLDGSTCGTLSTSNPVVALSLGHPASHLPDILVGFTSREVVSIAIACPWGTSHPKIVDRKGFTAVGPAGSFESCNAFLATLADGTVVAE